MSERHLDFGDAESDLFGASGVDNTSAPVRHPKQGPTLGAYALSKSHASEPRNHGHDRAGEQCDLAHRLTLGDDRDDQMTPHCRNVVSLLTYRDDVRTYEGTELMRGCRWFAGAMVTVAVLVSACGGGGGDESLDAPETSTDTVVEQTEADDTGSSTDTGEDPEDEPAAVSLTVDDLEMVVFTGWDLIWDEEFASLIELYTPDCQERLSVDDFEATLGQGVANLIELGVDFDDIVLEVAINDFVENTSATSTSTLTFPGEEPSEENLSVWVIEDDEWRRADCDEIAGAGAVGATGGIGSLEQPAAFGSAFDLDDWRATVFDVRDPAAEGLLAGFTEPPPPGQIDIMVTYVAVYFGEEIGSDDPFLLRGLGTTEYASFDSDCVLAGDVLAKENISTFASALPGQQLALATCLTVPRG